MGFCESLVKYILFFANLFFALAGIALIGLGVAVELKVTDVLEILFKDSQIIQQIPIEAIVIGCIVFVVAFFGYCGAIRESNCMLITYSLIMIILMVLKITLAVLIFVKKNEILFNIQLSLEEAFSSKTKFQIIERLDWFLCFVNLITKVRTGMGAFFSCCGLKGHWSYILRALTVPESCCASTPCPFNTYSGCNTIVTDFFRTYSVTIGAVVIVVGAIELVAAVFGLCLANHARNKNSCTRY